MKKAFCILLFLIALPIIGQTTSVTATATDSDSIAWASGTYTIAYSNSSPGKPYNTSTGQFITTSYSGTLNSSGQLSVTLDDVKYINPANGTWIFTICPDVSGGANNCGTVSIPIAGNSENVSGQIDAAIKAPRLGGGVGAYGYADVEFQAIPNNSYVVSPALTSQRCYTSSWGSCGGGGGSLPAATAAGQVLIATGAGTTYIAQNLPYVTPEQYGAKGNGSFYFDGVITSGTASISSATANFSSGEVGDPICVAAAASGGGQMCGTIASVSSATVAGLSFTPTASGTGLQFAFGTDDTTAFTNMFTACATTGCHVLLSNKFYPLTASFTMPRNITIQISGAGPGVPNTANNYSESNLANNNTGTRLVWLTKSLTSAALTYNGVSSTTSMTSNDLLEHLTLYGGVGVGRDGGGGDGVDILNWQGMTVEDVYVFDFVDNGVNEGVTSGAYSEALKNDMLVSSYNGGVGFLLSNGASTPYTETTSITNSIIEGNGLQGISVTNSVEGFNMSNDVVQWNNVTTAGTEIYLTQASGTGVVGCQIGGNYFESDTNIGSKSTGIVNSISSAPCNWGTNSSLNAAMNSYSVSAQGFVNAPRATIPILNGSISMPNGSLSITNTTVSSFVSPLSLFTPDLTAGEVTYMALGVNLSNNNAVSWDFKYAGSASTSNEMYMAFAGNTTNILSAFANNSIEFGETTAAAGPANGIAVGTTGQATIDGSGNGTFTTVKAASARKGTFVCTAAGTITIANTNELATSDVIISLNTAGGTISTAPAMTTVTSGTGFTVLCGAADTSTYNYTILN